MSESTTLRSKIINKIILNATTLFPYVIVGLFGLKALGFRKYIIDDQIVVNRIKKRISGISSEYRNNELYGHLIGKWYYAYIERDRCSSAPKHIITLLCSEETYNTLTLGENEVCESMVEKYVIEDESDMNSDTDTDTDTESENGFQSELVKEKKLIPFQTCILSIYTRNSEYSEQHYTKNLLKIIYKPPTPQQSNILNNIIDKYNTSPNLVVFIHGPPNTGKSMVGQLLAHNLGAHYYNNFNPFQPNTTLMALYSTVDPTKKNPLIILMNEIDIMINKIHNSTVQEHSSYQIQISDKSSWNNFFDDFHNLFQHVIIIMTSNKSPEYINSLDPSYIRKGRVDMIEYMDKVIE